MSETLKAGCIVVNLETKNIALIYRDNHNDYEFPKGHVEQNENTKECAIRETAEETKRDVKVIDETPFISFYVTPKNEHCKCYYYLAIDQGKSDNTSTDTHTLKWTKINDVDSFITYKSLKDVWEYFLPKIQNLLK